MVSPLQGVANEKQDKDYCADGEEERKTVMVTHIGNGDKQPDHLQVVNKALLLKHRPAIHKGD